MIKVTRWTPDTCECVLEYSWDDSVPEDQRVHTPTQSVFRCVQHSQIIDGTRHQDIVLNENKLKNALYKKLVDSFPALTKKDNAGKDALDDSKVSLIYDSDRVLRINVVGLSSKEKSDFESLQDSEHGAGKVKLI